MARAQQNATVEIESLGWMGETFRRLGRLDEGATAVREAVAIAPARATASALRDGWANSRSSAATAES